MPQILRHARLTSVASILLACGHLVATTQDVPRVVDGPEQAGPSQPGGPPLTGKSVADGGWPNIRVEDPYTRDAARRAVRGASQWLAQPECQTLFVEFKDERQLPLTERLRELDTDAQGYLRMVVFVDGGESETCKRHGVLAFTTKGSRVISLCGRDFERAWRRDPREVQATIIHELLHSLGLGENPPSPRAITWRVQRVCWQ